MGTSQLSATTLPYLEPAREVVSCCWSGLAAFKQIPSALAVVVVVVVVVVVAVAVFTSKTTPVSLSSASCCPHLSALVQHLTRPISVVRG